MNVEDGRQIMHTIIAANQLRCSFVFLQSFGIFFSMYQSTLIDMNGNGLFKNKLIVAVGHYRWTAPHHADASSMIHLPGLRTSRHSQFEKQNSKIKLIQNVEACLSFDAKSASKDKSTWSKLGNVLQPPLWMLWSRLFIPAGLTAAPIFRK